jgi:hypothetical protein
VSRKLQHAQSSNTGEADLAFGELLPEKPGWLEQEEYEERTSVGFHLERLTKSASDLLTRDFSLAEAQRQALDVGPQGALD